MSVPFRHQQAAHCETGVTANLLCHHGVRISESLVFGIGAGLHFAHFPFIKINDLPLTAFRSFPGSILKKATKHLGIKIGAEKFWSQRAAMASLDRRLDAGIPVGLQAGIFWLPYIPAALRFHFNAHNLVVYGRNGDCYAVSDPVMEEPIVCAREDIQKARFARGMFSPKGRMYYISSVPEHVDVANATLRGLNESCRNMREVAFPLVGVKGVNFLGNQIEKWPEKLGERRARLYLAQLIRMQEEIGTGGAGFRFMYAAFLQEASGVLGENRLMDLATRMTAIGDRWRLFALRCARICKARTVEGDTYGALGDMLRDCAVREDELFRDLRSILQERWAAA